VIEASETSLPAPRAEAERLRRAELAATGSAVHGHYGRRARQMMRAFRGRESTCWSRRR